MPTATLSFTNAGPNVNLFDTGGTRTITLTGTNTGANTFGILVTMKVLTPLALTKPHRIVGSI